MTATKTSIGVLVVLVIITLVSLIGATTEPSAHPVPATSVAPEVCAHQGPVQSVTLDNGVYHVRCHSGIIVLVAR